MVSLRIAITDNPEHQMANLLFNAFQTPVPPETFGLLRQELHERVKWQIYEDHITPPVE